MNLLLTGGTGYIGSHTAVLLANAGHSVVLFDNFYNSDRSVLARVNQITNQDIPCIEGDIRSTDLLVKVLSEFRIDGVMHFAGLKSVGESTQHPIKYFDNNVVGSISLIKAMQKTSVKTLVFSSSATVYGEPEYLPFDEAHPLKPTNPYGRTKLQVEEILQDIAKSDPSWRIALLRYFNPVGAHQSGLIGENPNGIPNNLMPYIMQVASDKLPYLNIFGDNYKTNDGTGERDYIHIMDLADGHLAALYYLKKKMGCEVFNLGTGKSVSVRDLVGAYEKASGKRILTKVVPRRAGDLAVCYADANKASEVLAWNASRGIDEMCRSAHEWQASLNNMNDVI